MTIVRGKQILIGLLFVFLANHMAQAASTTRVTAFEYDPANELLSKKIIEPDYGQFRVESSYGRDAWGNINTTTISSTATGSAAIASRTARTDYDARGQFPIKNTNALNQSETLAYNSKCGVVSTHTDPNQLPTQWQYDALCRKTLETRADGTQTKWDYVYCNGINGGSATCPANATYFIQTTPLDVNGTADGPWSKTYYDALERPIRTETLGFDGVSVIVQTTEYDNLGRPYHVSTPYYSGQTPRWTTDTYDALNRVVSETHQDGSTTTTSYNGLTTVATNGLQQTRTQVKNSQGQLVQLTDANNNSITYQYDPLGNLAVTTDPLGNVVTMVYDIRGNKTRMVDPDMGVWTYDYNALGQVVKQTDAKGQVTLTPSDSYDLLGRLTRRAEPDLISTWTYDNCSMGIGKLCAETADNGYSRTLSYDSLGRNNSTTTTIDTSYTTSVTYDPATGRVATQTYPNGFAVQYSYTPLGYLQEVLDNTSGKSYWKANTEDAEGHLLQQTFGNQIVTQQVYDSSTGRLSNIYAGAGNGVQNLSYTYDTIGNMQSRSDDNQHLTETFLYDNLRRLSSATVNSNGAGLVTTTYGYDALGNITSRSDLGTYTYDASGFGSTRPHAVTQVQLANGGTQNYSYDANGNLSSLVVGDKNGYTDYSKGRIEVYTSFNMPQAIGAPGISLAFAYGPEHQRIKQIAPSGTTIYLNPDNAGGLLYEKDLLANGSTVHTNYITAGDQVVAMVKQTNGVNTVNYLHKDHLGSITTVTDDAGNVVERFAYEPFGKRRFPSGVTDPNDTIKAVTTERGFTEHEHLDELGLIDMNGRIYDPQLGRFMSADPTVPHPLDIQSFNRYSYTRNNPLVYVDPNGFYDDYCGDCGGISGTGDADTPSSGQYFGGTSDNSWNSTATQTYYSVGGSGSPILSDNAFGQSGMPMWAGLDSGGASGMYGSSVSADGQLIHVRGKDYFQNKDGTWDCKGCVPDGVSAPPNPLYPEAGWQKLKGKMSDWVSGTLGFLGDMAMAMPITAGEYRVFGILNAAEKDTIVARTAAEILATNRVAGKTAEALAKTDLVAQGNKILGSQVAVWTSLGLRVIDHLVQTPEGQIVAYEVKSGQAVRSAAQLAKDAEIATKGGVFVGKNAPAALRGQTLAVPTFELRY
jgi:RHS repeat-associated protein